MAWKVERWFTEIFPGEDEIFSEYRALPPRELAIVTAAVLDAALAEALSMRLADSEKEVEDFLGLNGDGRAPVASFGARIQLALLVRVITAEDAALLRTVKEIRNLFAHRVRVNFLSPPVLKQTTKLLVQWQALRKSIAKSEDSAGTDKQIDEIAVHLSTIPEAGEGLLLAVFTLYHAYFYRLRDRIKRVNNGV